MKYYAFLFLLGGIIFCSSLLLLQKESVDNFAACVRVGFPVENENPPKCVTESNQVFYGLPQVPDDLSKDASNKNRSESSEFQKEMFPEETPEALEEREQSNSIFDPLKTAKRISLPSQVLLSVPFTPQAPHANWNPPFDESCEEASLIMVNRYLSGQEITPDTVSEKIRALVEW